MKPYKLLVPFLCLTLVTNAQERKIYDIPDIPGYHTMICDFHLHTVFSDGLVWPTVRVDEAWHEGLDAIAITDHLEYTPHQSDIPVNHNKAWEIAKEYASNKGIIVIPGTEITKGMPPGHFNAIFIKDAEAIYNDDYKKAIEEAANQGAFITWNHPGWKRQQPDTMRWFPEHTEIYDLGWMHGIEVANHNECYPAAVDWAVERNLTMLGCSDQHAPFTNTDFSYKNHRNCTFVFASERSEGGIREAMFNKRTIAYFEEKLFGREDLLLAFLNAAIDIIPLNEAKNYLSLVNSSDLYFKFTIRNSLYDTWSKEVIVEPQHEVIIKIPADKMKEDLTLTVENMITGYESKLIVPLEAVH